MDKSAEGACVRARRGPPPRHPRPDAAGASGARLHNPLVRRG